MYLFVCTRYRTYDKHYVHAVFLITKFLHMSVISLFMLHVYLFGNILAYILTHIIE